MTFLDSKTKKIYMIGIKGTGMSSLAVLLKKLGYNVTGSDTTGKFFTESQLKNHKIKYYEGFDAGHLQKFTPDLIVASTAYNDANPEITEAGKLRIPFATYPELVGELSLTLNSTAICGSHGKTTTTAMLGTIMQSGNDSITLAGTVADDLNKGVSRKPRRFIFEADEYQNKFLYYFPRTLILTNINYDHPDFFPNAKVYCDTFAAFVKKTLQKNGVVVFNFDDQEARRIIKKAKGKALGYGFDIKAPYHIHNVSADQRSFTLTHFGKKIGDIRLAVYGLHNIANAAGAAVMALHLKIPFTTIQKKLSEYKGVTRRMQVFARHGFVVIDDYGHHPTEIAATLSALRHRYHGKKIITVFQPHTYSRTKALLESFGRSFTSSDFTIILDIYGSAREKAGDINAGDVVKEIKKHTRNVLYLPTIKEAAEHIKRHANRGCVILTIGATDVWKLRDLL